MKYVTIDVNDKAPATTHNRIVVGLAKSPKVESNRTSDLSRTRSMTLATNSPVRTFVGSFKALSQFASGKITFLLAIIVAYQFISQDSC
jgi:hypothetical protein